MSHFLAAILLAGLAAAALAIGRALPAMLGRAGTRAARAACALLAACALGEFALFLRAVARTIGLIGGASCWA